MNNALPWIALGVSVLSAIFAGCAWWINREKLRLDLYNRRFDIYLKTLDFWYAMSEWSPTQREKDSAGLQDSRELRDCQKAFIKATREAKFLFDDKSGIQMLLEQMHSDAIGIIGYKRDLVPKLGPVPEMIKPSYDQFLERQQRLDRAIPMLEEKLAPYLDFHSLWSVDQLNN